MKVFNVDFRRFQTEDVISLLATRDGSYAAVCSLDFSKPPDYYDTFALRDFGGYETVTSTFPYFRSKASRDAMLSGRPVPVQSCWNGIGASIYILYLIFLLCYPGSILNACQA